MTKLNNNKDNNDSVSLVVNTSKFSVEDFSIFLDCSEKIETMKRNSLRNNRRYVPVKTSEELFEVSTLDEDEFLKALENNSSYHPNLDLTQGIEHLMKYFEEDVTVDVDDDVEAETKPIIASQPEIVKQTPMKKATPKMVFHSTPIVAARVAELKPQPQKKMKNKIGPKVKKIAEMFNEKIKQITTLDRSYLTRRKSDKYQRMSEEVDEHIVAVPEKRQAPPVPMPRTKLIVKNETTESEETFSRLSVKDKINLFNKFMSASPHLRRKSIIVEKKIEAQALPIEDKTSETTLDQTEITESVMASIDIPTETQTTELIESAVETETIAIQDSIPVTGDLHVSTLTVVLSPSPKKWTKWTAALPLELSAPIQPTSKRGNNQIGSTISMDIYAPPKKIRRTRAERKLFQNSKLESLFFKWLKDEQGMSYSAAENFVDAENESKEVVVEASLASELSEKHKEDAIVEEGPAEEILESGEEEIVESAEEIVQSERDSASSDFEFIKPIRPPRKKKMKRTLTWMDEESLVEKTTIIATDSESDCRSDIVIPKLFKSPLPPPRNLRKQIEAKSSDTSCTIDAEELSNKLINVNSPRKIKNAYTLTVMPSPSPRVSLGGKKKKAANRLSWSSQTETETDTTPFPSLPGSPVRFGSSADKSPLFIKLSENPFLQEMGGGGSRRNSTTPRRLSMFDSTESRRGSFFDPDSRRNSLQMDVIFEEIRNIEENMNSIKSQVRGIENLDGHVNGSSSGRTSSFWVSFGSCRVAVDIWFNSMHRLRILHAIFSEKAAETTELELTFGIDNMKFSFDDPECKAEVSKRLPTIEGCSHYWFAAGDLAVPFIGKHMSREKIANTFAFIRSSVDNKSEIKFGIDSFEFSIVPDMSGYNPKFSIESSYSMLVGLHGQSNGLEGRSQFSWPSTSRNGGGGGSMKTSDLEESEFDSEYSGGSPFSLSPFERHHNFDEANRNSISSFGSLDGALDIFSAEYENDPLDKIFDTKLNSTPKFF